MKQNEPARRRVQNKGCPTAGEMKIVEGRTAPSHQIEMLMAQPGPH